MLVNTRKSSGSPAKGKEIVIIEYFTITRLVILYIRLSREDLEKGESNSIKSQESILKEFAKELGYKKEQIISIKDDGFSGTNTDRSGLKDLKN